MPYRVACVVHRESLGCLWNEEDFVFKLLIGMLTFLFCGSVCFEKPIWGVYFLDQSVHTPQRSHKELLCKYIGLERLITQGENVGKYFFKPFSKYI